MSRPGAGRRPMGRRLAAAGGVAGPVIFTVTWWRLGRRPAGPGRPAYSPLVDPISRLAAVGAQTRPAMTAGFLAYAAGVGACAGALRGRRPRVAACLAANAASMVGIAALPLDGPGGDRPHVVAATGAYASLALAPLLSGGLPPPSGGGRRLPRTAAGVGATTAALLLASQVHRPRRGLWQRLGLTLGQAWIVGAAVRSVAGGA